MKSAKQLDGLRLGCAGEYMVAAMMNLKGWDAALTQKNYPAVDIFGYNKELDKNIRIQVKSGSVSSFLIGFRHDNRDTMATDIEGPYVFVYFKDRFSPEYFIIDKEELIRLIVREDDKYFNRDRIKPIDPKYPIAVFVDTLLPYKDQWDNLWK